MNPGPHDCKSGTVPYGNILAAAAATRMSGETAEIIQREQFRQTLYHCYIIVIYKTIYHCCQINKHECTYSKSVQIHLQA